VRDLTVKRLEGSDWPRKVRAEGIDENVIVVGGGIRRDAKRFGVAQADFFRQVEEEDEVVL
jgi:hypothetical protein